jgi:hypothetical protein
MLQAINIVVGTAWTLCGLICLGLAGPLIAKRVSPNSLYGVRFPEAFRSHDAWFAINHFGGKRMALWSIPQIICGVVAYFVPLEGNPLLTLLLGIAPILFVLIPALESWRFAKRYDADAKAQNAATD